MKALVVWNTILTILLIVALASGGGTYDPGYDSLAAQVETNQQNIDTNWGRVTQSRELIEANRNLIVGLGEALVDDMEAIGEAMEVNRRNINANWERVTKLGEVIIESEEAMIEFVEGFREVTMLTAESIQQNRDAIIQITEYLEQQDDIDELKMLLQLLAGIY